MFFWSLFGWGGNGIFLCALGEHCYQGRKLAQFWAGVVLVNAIVTTLLYVTLPFARFAPLAVVVAMALELLPYLVTTRGHIGKRVFFALNATCIMAVIAVISAQRLPTMSPLAGGVKLVVCAVLALGYVRFVRKPLDATVCHLDHHWLWINGMGAMFSAMLYYVLLGYARSTMTLEQLVGMTVLAVAVYVGMFYTLHYMSVAITLTQQQLQEEAVLGQVERLVELAEQSRSMRHDLRHHNQAIATFVNQGQYDALLAYLADYDQSLEKELYPQYCAHPLVNNILGVYQKKAAAADIQFTPRAILGADCGIGQRDLLGLLSNVLENAIQSCDSGGEINLKLFEKNRKCIIVCETTAKAPIAFSDGIPQATQHNQRGITSILRTVDRYDGLADFRQSQGLFTAHIVLNVG